MSRDVERVARALMAAADPVMDWNATTEGWRNRYRSAARAAMRETLLIAAEAAQAIVNDGTFGPGAERDTAQGFVDWLKGRADAE